MINQFLSTLLLSVFFFAPPILLGLRLWKGRPGWWIIGLGLPLLSWICMNGVVDLHFADLTQQIETLEAKGMPVPDELIDDFVNDGGPKVFALFFGWLYVVPFFLIWMIPFGMIQLIRRIKKTRKESASD